MKSIESEKLTDIIKHDSITSNDSAQVANTTKQRPGVLNLLHPVFAHDEAEPAAVVNPVETQD